ncbi:protein MULTIPOLAR SPINDLE 1 isoform X1 [Populus alba]
MSKLNYRAGDSPALRNFQNTSERMASSEPATDTRTASSPTDDQSLKLAVAISLLRSKLLQKQPPPPPPPPPPSNPPSETDVLRWKRKAKERKQELLRLREDLREAEDASQCDLFPQTALCKCYFFDNLGKLSPKPVGDGSDRRFNDILRRRFIRQVRIKERRKRINNSNIKLRFSDICSKNEAEQLRAAVDFLVELCDTTSPARVEEANFANWSHQAADFILASLRNLLSIGNNIELIEGIVSRLIVRLVKRMCSPSHGDESRQTDTDTQLYIQQLIRKLGCEPHIGQRAILSVSQRISMVAENLLFLDPFDEAFSNMHECLFIMIQLIEFLISDYLLTWSRDEGFDHALNIVSILLFIGFEIKLYKQASETIHMTSDSFIAVLFEEWVTSVLHARKALELLESRNGLYVLYMDRVTGELAKHVGQVSSSQKLSQDILDNLFC